MYKQIYSLLVEGPGAQGKSDKNFISFFFYVFQLYLDWYKHKEQGKPIFI